MCKKLITSGVHTFSYLRLFFNFNSVDEVKKTFSSRILGLRFEHKNGFRTTCISESIFKHISAVVPANLKCDAERVFSFLKIIKTPSYNSLKNVSLSAFITVKHWKKTVRHQVLMSKYHLKWLMPFSKRKLISRSAMIN